MVELISQIRRLSSMIEDEISGQPVDVGEARKMVLVLAPKCPQIGGSLQQMLDRFGACQRPRSS